MSVNYPTSFARLPPLGNCMHPNASLPAAMTLLAKAALVVYAETGSAVASPSQPFLVRTSRPCSRFPLRVNLHPPLVRRRPTPVIGDSVRTTTCLRALARSCQVRLVLATRVRRITWGKRSARREALRRNEAERWRIRHEWPHAGSQTSGRASARMFT
jgi:hypothetical protein